MANLAEVVNQNLQQDGSRVTLKLMRMAEEKVTLPRTRRSRPGDAARLLVSVLREVDETVLPRQITLTTDTGHRADLTVSNRRLKALAIGDMPCDEPSDPDSAARLFAARLAALVEGAERVTFSYARCAAGFSQRTIGCSARSLAAAAGVNPVTTGQGRTIEGFLGSISAHCLAWILTEQDGRLRRGGDPVRREALLAFRDEARPDPQARFDTRAAKCTVLPLPNGELLVSARDTSCTLQALLPAQALPEVVAAWQMRR
ncbi:hypothetical protein [Albibacillus kandeliae]|uniref:hypothetical protein n=1 Tax=Albibacillus kandeliae TaxID=2174228 RepID=UPI000D6951B7|nr:hypothetical protein [Albibacillus kandeliae]